jgi:hypothetical protein
MGNSQEGLTDIEEVTQYIMIGNGKKLQVHKIGTLHRTAFQEDGTSLDIELKGYKYVPQLQVNLFSITKALDQGWNLSNRGVLMILTKGKASITFDKIFKTDTGKVVGIELLTRLEETPKDEVAFSEGPTNTDETTTTDIVEYNPGNQGLVNNTSNEGTDPENPQENKEANQSKAYTWDINRMHKIFNHASEDVLRSTAKEKNWKLTGKFETCRFCKESNAQQKGVAKSSDEQCKRPGERLFFDITSIKAYSFGGKKFWLVIVDDATNLTWSFFLKQKSDTAETAYTLLKHLNSHSVNIKYIRCDNAGENVSLENLIKKDPNMNTISFE